MEVFVESLTVMEASRCQSFGCCVGMDYEVLVVVNVTLGTVSVYSFNRNPRANRL